MGFTDLLLLAAFVWGFALLSARLEGTPLTAPMVFVGLGLAFGPSGLDWLNLDASGGPFHTLAEATLVLVLFGDATRIDLKSLRRQLGLPVRLLGVGLPGSILLGSVLAKLLLPELEIFEALVVGAILAPTDAALGQAVVSNPDVPVGIRQALNVESGLNDGIALPFVLVFASLASMGHGEVRSAQEWVQFGLLQVTLGPLVGAVIGGVGGKLLDRAVEQGTVEPAFERLAGLAIALACFAGAESVGGNGFLAAFVGGMVFGGVTRDRCTALVSFLEAEGQLAMLLVFTLFGASFVVDGFAGLDVRSALFVAASLTVTRMIPVSVSLLGGRLDARTHLFLGWFGPRGIATILYTLIVIEASSMPHEGLIVSVVMSTAAVSVLLHGLSAAPGAAAYAKWARPERCPVEHAPAAEHPLGRATPSRHARTG